MLLTFLQAKIHHARVTARHLDYHGSLTIDEDLIEAAGMRVGQQIQVYDSNNGARFETYILRGPRGKKQIQVNGAAARLVEAGDRIIICTYCQLTEAEVAGHKPKVVLCDDTNGIVDVIRYE